MLLTTFLTVIRGVRLIKSDGAIFGSSPSSSILTIELLTLLVFLPFKLIIFFFFPLLNTLENDLAGVIGEEMVDSTRKGFLISRKSLHFHIQQQI